MISDSSRDQIRSGKGFCLLWAGSGSDEGHLRSIRKELDRFLIPHQTFICSAHKQPQAVMTRIDELNVLSQSTPHALYVCISVAGGTDALSGTLSYHLYAPVVSCPPDFSADTSSIRNPPGSSNAVIIRPANVARFVAQVFSSRNADVKERLDHSTHEKIHALEEADRAHH